MSCTSVVCRTTKSSFTRQGLITLLPLGLTLPLWTMSPDSLSLSVCLSVSLFLPLSPPPLFSLPFSPLSLLSPFLSPPSPSLSLSPSLPLPLPLCLSPPSLSPSFSPLSLPRSLSPLSLSVSPSVSLLPLSLPLRLPLSLLLSFCFSFLFFFNQHHYHGRCSSGADLGILVGGGYIICNTYNLPATPFLQISLSTGQSLGGGLNPRHPPPWIRLCSLRKFSNDGVGTEIIQI